MKLENCRIIISIRIRIKFLIIIRRNQNDQEKARINKKRLENADTRQAITRDLRSLIWLLVFG